MQDRMTTTIAAHHALLSTGWADAISIEIDDDGVISDIRAGTSGADHTADILLPALANVHSHSFQRAMAGLAETRGPNTIDDFWTWRRVMYRFLQLLTPDDIEAIAALVQMEMLEAGYAAQAEFHYVHHAPGGDHYDNIAETSLRHLEAAKQTGIGYTHLPVLYMQGGLDGRPLVGGQLRFGCTIDEFEMLYQDIQKHLQNYASDYRLGVAPHSLRAVSSEGLNAVITYAPNSPIHIHAAEQVKEIEEVVATLGTRPVEWLLSNTPIDSNWCLIHATHMQDTEVDRLAASGAVAGLCPLTEANLGDGIFNATRFIEHGGVFGIGSDSNILIRLSEELRQLETSQRLRDRHRVILTSEQTLSNGRFLYETAAIGGARAVGRNTGRLEIGAGADMVALSHDTVELSGLRGDTILDTWLFACDDHLVTDVWAAGRLVVSEGRHIQHAAITQKYKMVIERLRAAL